jgi:hypothetical protein
MGLKEVIAKGYNNSFNEKFALVSAGFNGPIAAFVNSSHGSSEMFWAGFSQAASSFVSTGVTARIVQHFSPLKNRFASYFFGSLVPAAVTFAMSYIAHRINGTPELIESCIAPTVISYTTSYVTNYVTRRGHMLPRGYLSERDDREDNS